MPSQNSKNQRLPIQLRAENDCDERLLASLMEGLAHEIGNASKTTWILLEGQMGAGKSTAARMLIRALGVEIAPEGSPTFALAHEYRGTGDREIVHLDLYRIESQLELEAAGIPSYFWERQGAVVLSEWTSRFSELRSALENTAYIDNSVDLFKIELDFSATAEHLRQIQISKT